MITVLRSANIAPGVLAEDAFGWAIKVATYLNNKWGTNVQVQRNVGGDIFQIHWLTTYDSLSHLEEVTPKIEADPDYAALLAEATTSALFSRENVIDKIYQSVP